MKSASPRYHWWQHLQKYCGGYSPSRKVIGFVFGVLVLAIVVSPALLAQQTLPGSSPQSSKQPEPRYFSPIDSRTVTEWNLEIQNQMLDQNFRQALALCLAAQRQYPAQESFRNYEASIREYLQVEQRSDQADSSDTESDQLQVIYHEEEPKILLRERLVAMAKLDPLLAIYGGVGLHRASTVDGMTELNPLTEAVINLYISSNLGLNLFYYDPHWNLRFEHTLGTKVNTTLYSLVFGGTLRFRNKFSDFSNRSNLSFVFDVGVGLYDLFTLLLVDYQPKPVLILGFGFSDRPFYHFGGIEALAGLQIDLSLSLFLSLEANSRSVVQTGNWEAILWQSFGILRFGLSYRGSISEYYNNDQVFFVQHQFSFLVGLEWRTSFQ